VTSYAFNAALVDGGFGLVVLEGSNDFASLDVRTNDSQFDQPDVPRVSISDVMLSENESGQTETWLTVNLSEVLGSDVTVAYSTVDGSAVAGEDYLATGGILTFAAGETTKTIGVTVYGDTDVENDENFFVILSDANGVELGDTTGVVTIMNDDTASALPAISIADVQISEGNKANKTKAMVTISLSEASTTPVSVNLTTQDGSAISGSDYVAVSDTITFAPGETSHVYTLIINGERINESDEYFSLKLSNAAGATISDDTGVITIINDDRGKKLMAAYGPDELVDTTSTLSDAALAPIVDEAIARWDEAVNLDDQVVAMLHETSFYTVDLDGLELGLTSDNEILIDDDAAGFGWFVDETPWEAMEFAGSDDGHELLALADSEAFGHIDLLTVVMHEIGHFLGFDHAGEEETLMYDTLETGIRKDITASDSANDPIAGDSGKKKSLWMVFDESKGEFVRLAVHNSLKNKDDFGFPLNTLFDEDIFDNDEDDEDDWIMN
jgi:hypothetical protein